MAIAGGGELALNSIGRIFVVFWGGGPLGHTYTAPGHGGGGCDLIYTRRWARALAILRWTVHSLSLLVSHSVSETVSSLFPLKLPYNPLDCAWS